MNENMLYAAFFFPAAAAVLVFFMKYTSEILQARVRLAQDEAYRALAMQTGAAQAQSAAALAAFGTTLAEIQAQLTGISKILKDVE
jgi:hypothetical protein